MYYKIFNVTTSRALFSQEYLFFYSIFIFSPSFSRVFVMNLPHCENISLFNFYCTLYIIYVWLIFVLLPYIVERINKMAVINLKKGHDLCLSGAVTGNDIMPCDCDVCAVVPDDFPGVVPRPDVKEGDVVKIGDRLFHDRRYAEITVTSPVAGTVKEVRRGERRKIEAIVIEKCANSQTAKQFDVSGDTKTVLLESGLWASMLRRPYAVVPSPEVRPRDIFVTAFDSSPLAPDLSVVLGGKVKYMKKGVEVLAKLTDGNVYVGVRAGFDADFGCAVVNVFEGPHPAGNAGVQAANVKPVNKGETVWTLDIVTVARIGELFTTGVVNFDTVVAVTGSGVKTPRYVSCTMGASVANLLAGNLAGDVNNLRVISGNVLTGNVTGVDGFLRFPYRHVTVIEELEQPGEFMGWASLSPKKFSVYRSFFSWLCPRKCVTLDSKLNGGERAIVMAGEYDRMLPMDIYAEFLIKSIIAFDIDKMEQLGIYEVAPEDFALCEFADTSKLELQRIVRDGLDRMRKEME